MAQDNKLPWAMDELSPLSLRLLLGNLSRPRTITKKSQLHDGELLMVQLTYAATTAPSVPLRTDELEA